MNAMKAVVSSLFCIMMFPFNGNIVTLNQLSYYDPHANTNLTNVLPTVGEVNQPPYVDILPSVYKDSDLLERTQVLHLKSPPQQMALCALFSPLKMHLQPPWHNHKHLQ